MSKKDEALKLALEALEANQPVNYCMNNNGEKFPMMQEDPFRFERNSKAITVLREALAEQPAQRTWVGLTNVEIASACKKNGGSEWWWKDIEEFARAIEAKLKEKNNG